MATFKKAPLIMCRRTVNLRICDLYEAQKAQLIEELSSAAYVCTTVDIWSLSKRSFLGMTAHWVCNRMYSRVHCSQRCYLFFYFINVL